VVGERRLPQRRRLRGDELATTTTLRPTGSCGEEGGGEAGARRIRALELRVRGAGLGAAVT
jgi:hypothetical protein